MKKCVLSAAVLALLVPAIHAMDGAAEPVVEVEVPAVETQVETEVEVTVASEEVPADEVKVEVEAVEVNDVVTFLPVEGEVPEVAICDIHPVDLPEGAVEKITTDEMVTVEGEPEIAVCFEGDPSLMFRSGVAVGEGGEGVEGGEPIMYMFGAPVEGVPETAQGGEVDPKLVDLASQSGVAFDNHGEGEVTVTAIEDSPTRGGEGEIQPYYRSLTGSLDGGGEPIVVNNFAGGLSGGIESQSGAPLTTASDLADPQLLNDEQRGAVRGLRSEAEESTKTRSGLGKFMAKFRKPKSEVTQASATVTDKSMSSKLAEIDRMRDTALRTGDQKALAKADKLEKELRAKAGTATRIPTRTK
jgi:hypothetical protein